MAFRVIEASSGLLGSPAALEPPTGRTMRIGAVQTAWHADPAEHEDVLAAGVSIAARRGARVVCLQELTLSPYFAVSEETAVAAADDYAEPIREGRTTRFAQRLAAEEGVYVQASLFERSSGERRGYNTAICVAPDGSLVARTRKLHIPAFPGYREDLCFNPGDTGFPVVEIEGARFGFPTCWDQWFPEVARIYSMSGAEILVYPTAIGSEPHLGDFDTEPLWRQTISANGLANAMFMVAVNRIGTEDGLCFYGSSFVSDPYGRVVARAPRDEEAVLVVDLDLDQRRDWLAFGLFTTRRPEIYSALTRPQPTP